MKPKVAFFDFASCEGCQLALLNCEEILLEILDKVELVEFREAASETAPRYDIAFVEGSIHRDMDADRLRDIRARSTYLVALGSCAVHGNVQARGNFVAPAMNYAGVYGEEARNRVQVDGEFWPLWSHTRVRPVGDVVPVDFALRGCPMVPGEFLHLVKSLLKGTQPHFPATAVCVECKRAENECVFERGETCLGPITWSGCDAVCVTNGSVCDGCRGVLPYANTPAHRELLGRHRVTAPDLRSRYRLFCGAEPIGKEG